MSYVRTSEHRALRAELIRRWKPWEKSTGPKSEVGKAKVAQNGFRGGAREALRDARKLEQLMAADAAAVADLDADAAIHDHAEG